MKTKIVELDIVEKQRIYRILTSKLPFNEEIPLARFNKILTDSGVDKLNYGIKKAKDFCVALPEFLVVADSSVGGIPQSFVSLVEVKEWLSSSWRLPRIMPEGFSPEETGSDPGAIEYSLHLHFQELVSIPSQFNSFIRKHYKTKSSTEKILSKEYSNAYNSSNTRFYNNLVMFPLSILREDGTPVVAVLAKGDQEQNLETSESTEKKQTRTWYLSCLDTYVSTQLESARYIGGELEDFAFFDASQKKRILDDLQSMCIPEEWSFNGDNPEKHYIILDNYIRFTFYRLKLEDKICFSANEEYSAFNTGLVSKTLDDIYVIFKKNNSFEEKYQYFGACTAGQRGNGKLLVHEFSSLPERASYYSDPSELFFDVDKTLVLDYEHIILEGIHRLPLSMLEDELHNSREAMRLIECIKQAKIGEEALAHFVDLADLIREDHRLMNKIRSRIDFAISLAKKQVIWDYRSAVPVYHPRTNAVDLVIPLSLISETCADIALVVSQVSDNCYQGQTILTLRQAYLNARLIGHISCSWLSLDNIKCAKSWNEKRILNPK